METLSQQWMEAAQRNDVKTLGLLMAEDFTLVHPSQDRVTTRAQWLSALSRIETKQFRYEHLKVVHYGSSLAVVSAVFVVDAVMDSHTFSPITAVTDVWEKRGGKWQVVTDTPCARRNSSRVRPV
jgi:ketosteroid isomerase-like protein